MIRALLAFLAGALYGWLVPGKKGKAQTKVTKKDKRRSTAKGLGYGLGIGLALGLLGWAADKHGASAKEKVSEAKDQITSALSGGR